jgi:TetR/AcrR family transcriptional repressor of nem operon
MRYAPDHKERSRSQIVATAARLFRRDGVVATGVVGLMKGAGLTQGAFYAHFDSKEALIREAMLAAVDQTVEGISQLAEAAGGGATSLKALINAYLSMTHLDRVDNGCVFAAAGAELAREPVATREALSAASGQLISVIERYLPHHDENSMEQARSIFGLLAGTLQLARLTPDRTQARAILERGRRSALILSEAPATV